jgi:hypothetical protein
MRGFFAPSPQPQFATQELESQKGLPFQLSLAHQNRLLALLTLQILKSMANGLV